MTKPSATTPREFWIALHPNYHKHDFVSHSAFDEVQRYVETIHVIEHQAYLESQAKVAALEAELNRVKDEYKRYKNIYDKQFASGVLVPSNEYQDIISERKILRERVEVCKAALEFYGNWKSWDKDNRICTDGLPANIIDDDFSEVEYLENDGETYKDIFGGKRAREALEKIK